MPKRKRKPVAAAEGQAEGALADKIAGALALLATRGMGTDEAALKLDGIGFSSREIAGLLDVGLNYVNVARHRKKDKSKKPKAK